MGQKKCVVNFKLGKKKKAKENKTDADIYKQKYLAKIKTQQI